jgi:hypothetical protein
MRAEVRCCCNPCKLLGTVEVAGELQNYVRYTFALTMPHKDYIEKVAHLSTEVILEVGRWQAGDYLLEMQTGGLALKSMNTPIDTLRRITTWKDA